MTEMQRLENILENVLFGARWLLVPAYLMLVLSLLVLAGMSVGEFVQLVKQIALYAEAGAVAQVLVIVDLVLVMNLVLMIIFVGYVNFVSVIHPNKTEDWPEWMGTLDYGGLKIQVLGSIIAIAAIKLLKEFLDLSVGHDVPARLLWMTVILCVFVVSAVLLSISNKLHVSAGTLHSDRWKWGKTEGREREQTAEVVRARPPMKSSSCVKNASEGAMLYER